MKTSRLVLLWPLLGLAAFAGCSSSAGDTEASEGALTGAELDDAVATTILSGGCSVAINRGATTTRGSGGACPTQLSKVLDLLEGKLASRGAADLRRLRARGPSRTGRTVPRSRARFPRPGAHRTS